VAPTLNGRVGKVSLFDILCRAALFVANSSFYIVLTLTSDSGTQIEGAARMGLLAISRRAIKQRGASFVSRI